MTEQEDYSDALLSDTHKLIKKVTIDIDSLKANTAIAAMMSYLNKVYDRGFITKGEMKTFLTLLNPFAPHITEEMWEIMNFGGMLNEQKWPEYDEAKCKDDTVEIAVQVNGKVRARINISVDMSQQEVLDIAKADEKVASQIQGSDIVKEIYVKGKLVNIVVK